MDTQYFPHFIRANFDHFEITNEDAIEIGDSFKEYLLEKFQGKEDKLEPIWDISPLTVIKNDGRPDKVHGYHPALLVHFTNFVEYHKNNPDQ